jgi:hypothetical protein
MTFRIGAALGLALLVCACDKSPTAPAETVAPPSVTEHFAGSLPVGGFRFYSFSVVQNGTVNITLNTVGGTGVAPDVTIGLGLGAPNAQDCVTRNATVTAAGANAQVTGVYAPGVYCARVYDVGNLPGPATFAVTIAHP